MKRRILSLLLAVCMMGGFCIPAWATGSVYTDYGSLETTVTATVDQPQIKVTLPTVLSFNFDPSLGDVTTGNCEQQVTGGKEFKILNNSAVDLYLSINEFSTSAGFDLCTYLSELDSTHMLFTIYPQGSVPTFGEVYNNIGALKSFTSYNVTPANSPIPHTTEQDISKGATFCIGALAKPDFVITAGNKFTITLTFVVSTAQPGSASRQ